MKFKGINTALFIALLLSSSLAVYFFLQTRKVKREFAVTSSLDQREKIALEQEQLISIDSLMMQGNYTKALAESESKLNQGLLLDTNSMKLRIVLMKRLLSLQKKIYHLDSSQLDSIAIETFQIIPSVATPKEVRDYDSLQFVLRKREVELEKIKGQLKRKSHGEYLTFESTKGTTIYFVGEVSNEKANGQGIALLSTGSRYEGEWKNNLRHGKGTFYWPDGEYYQGEYHNDQRQGLGSYYWPNGEKFTGQWEKDLRNGEGIFYDKHGEIVASGIWKDDELVVVQKD
ncbi:MORN repeat-containing protein [Reichenbachiella ulvae]|uniref:MORN repeat-containing protein n=1 Tax=Reichenbachiella ulvae TaxID=2980104 RepID=A0ABT3CUH8_9BACT|nr:hypothetical protein [Reichenbachiella ulvae]MCV9387333.1 hypothetical protein [Reichenbachiella ulvae]